MLNLDQLQSSRFFLVFIAGLAALAPMAIDMYMPLMPDMATSLSAPIAQVNLTISAFMIGVAFGQLIGGPLSDQLGRKKVGLMGLAVYVSACVGMLVATTLEATIALRAWQALGGGFASVICMAQARDVFDPKLVAAKYANIIIVVLIAPMLAPSVGAALVDYGWRSAFLVQLLFAALMFVLYVVFVPETHVHNPGRVRIAEMFRGYWLVINLKTGNRRLSLQIALFAAFSMGLLFCYVTNATLIFVGHYHFSAYEFAVSFGVMAAMLMVGNRAAAQLLKRIEIPAILVLANTTQLAVSIGLMTLIFLGVTDFWVVYTGLAVLIFTCGAISPVAGGYFIGFYSSRIGAASSLYSSLTFAFGAMIGALAAVLSDGQLLPIFIVFVCCAVMARIFLIRALIGRQD